MNKENLQLRRLGENDKVLAFDCGDEDLNDFILTDAPLYYRVRLATSKSCRGEGIGSMIIRTIIASYRNDSKAGCRFITVDAYADALPFYYKQGFLPLSKTDEGADTRLLYFDLQSVNPHE